MTGQDGCLRNKVAIPLRPTVCTERSLKFTKPDRGGPEKTKDRRARTIPASTTEQMFRRSTSNTGGGIFPFETTKEEIWCG